MSKGYLQIERPILEPVSDHRLNTEAWAYGLKLDWVGSGGRSATLYARAGPVSDSYLTLSVKEPCKIVRADTPTRSELE
jgi:hypothetical protein